MDKGCSSRPSRDLFLGLGDGEPQPLITPTQLRDERDPGIGGLVLNTNGDPVKNAKVQIFLGTSKTATATVYTDADGWYMWQYRWTGKSQSFVVTRLPPAPYKPTTQSQTVTLKANGYLVVNFNVP